MNIKSTITDHMATDFKQNPHCLLKDAVIATKEGWVSKNTAILVVHGIGTQLPLETLDHFGRGLVQQYEEHFKYDLKLKHEIVKKNGS